MRCALLGCLLGLSGGCEASIEPAELAEVCGAQGPFRALALAPDEQLGRPPLRVGDRVLYLIHEVGPIGPDGSLAPVVATTVWATGPCGESPAQVASRVDDLFTVDAWPDVPLGCIMETGQVVSLDPTGARPPHLVFAGAPNAFRCGLRWTRHGLVVVTEHDEELGALELHPYPTDPYGETSEPVTLLDPVRLTPAGRSGPGVRGWTIAAFEDFALALTADDALVRVDLADGTPTTLQAGVGLFDASRAGKYVLWQGPFDRLADEPYPVGEVFLRDVAAGTDARLAETSIRFSHSPMWWAEEGALQLALASLFEGGPTRFYRVPGLESVELGGDRLYLAASVDADRWLLVSIEDPGLDLLDLRSGERRRLFDRGGNVMRHRPDAVTTLDVPLCCVDGDERDEGPVWRVPYDLSPPQRLARRATRFLALLDDGRLVSPVAIDAQMIGTLVIVEPDTQQELRIDDRVPARSLDASRAAAEDLLTYSVADGERSGVYLARLAPRERPRGEAFARSSGEAQLLEVRPGPDGRPMVHTRRGDAAGAGPGVSAGP